MPIEHKTLSFCRIGLCRILDKQTKTGPLHLRRVRYENVNSPSHQSFTCIIMVR